MKNWPPKDPDEVLDYVFDWTPRNFPDDMIVEGAGTTATVSEGTVVIDSHSVMAGGKKTVTWLSGGTDGETCSILLHSTTQQGREFEETVTIKIKAR